MAQLVYIFYFSDQKQWPTKHNNGHQPFSSKIYPHLNNRSEKTIFKKFCFIFSGWKIKFSHTCSWALWSQSSIWEDKCTTGSAPTLALALGVFWEERLEHFARCSGTWMLQETQTDFCFWFCKPSLPSGFSVVICCITSERTLLLKELPCESKHSLSFVSLSIATGNEALQCTKPSLFKGGTLLPSHLFGLFPAVTMNSCPFDATAVTKVKTWPFTAL